MNNDDDKAKLKHDYLNAIVIINSLTKSSESFLKKLGGNIEIDDFNRSQIEKILYSMKAVRNQTEKLENYFQSLIGE